MKIELEMGESEYDVVALPLGQFGDKFAIEAKDFDRDNEQVDPSDSDSEVGGLRYQLITQPRREAENADLELITIVNGLEKERFNDVSQHAGPSNVVLLDDSNYKERLRKILINGTINGISEKLQSRR